MKKRCDYLFPGPNGCGDLGTSSPLAAHVLLIQAHPAQSESVEMYIYEVEVECSGKGAITEESSFRHHLERCFYGPPHIFCNGRSIIITDTFVSDGCS